MASTMTRRSFVKNAGALVSGMVAPGLTGCAGIVSASRKKSDIRIDHISFGYDEHIFRAPVGFAGAMVSRATMVTVKCSVHTAGGRVAKGFGSMPFNHTFSFPSKKLSNEIKNNAMKALAAELAKLTGGYHEFDHPLDINWNLTPLYLKAAAEVSERLRLADPIPKLCTLVTAAAFDAAIHDAFGKVHGINCFATYGPEFMNHDLSRYLGAEYRGKYPSHYLLRRHKARMTLCHLVAGKEKIFLAGGDMSCPGAALIQTTNLQARVPTITSVEANARQYLPQANKAWESRFPGMFRVTDGMLRTREVSGPGLGAPEIQSL